MKYLNILPIIFILLCGAVGADASVCSQLFNVKEKKSYIGLDDGRFLAPNEGDPRLTIPIFNKMKPGTLLTVGTERGFLYAGMSSNVLSLALMDRDPGVVRFNQINVALLKSAKNRADYLYLRLEADKKEWHRRGLLSLDVDIIEVWEWWRENVKYDPEVTRASENFFMHYENGNYFKGANYLYINEQFERVKKLADENKIFVGEADLGHPMIGKMIASVLKPALLPITMIDFSNVWHEQYAGAKGTDQFLNSIQGVLDPQAILILTSQSDNHGGWQYYAYRTGDIFSIQVRNNFWKWVEGATLEKKQTAYLGKPSPLVRSVLDGQYGNRFENLANLLRSSRESEKGLALEILLDAKILTAEIVVELLKVSINSHEKLAERANSILGGVKNQPEYLASILEVALEKMSDKRAENLLSIVSTNASLVPEINRAPMIVIFYQALRTIRPCSAMIEMVASLDSIEKNKSRLREELVRLATRLENFNSIYAGHIHEFVTSQIQKL